MGMLFGFLETDQPLNTSLAGYFGRVMSSLLMRRTTDLMAYLKKKQEVLEHLVRHLRTTSIAEVVVQLVGSDEQSYMYYGSHHMYWLADTPLMEMLINRLSPEFPVETQANAAEILGAIAHTQPSPLASQLGSNEYMEMLFQRALAPGCRGVLVPTLNVCVALLEPKRVSTESSYASPDVSTSKAGAGKDSSLKLGAVQSILKELPKLVDLLKHHHIEGEGNAGGPGVLMTTFGQLEPPLGSRRWKVVELLSVLASTPSQGVEEALISTGALKICMDLFVHYPFNNLLHHAVSSLLVSCLSGSQAVQMHLLKDCALPSWLASVPPAISATNGAAPLRAGYMGHITSLGNRLVSVGRQSQEVRVVLSGNQTWELFVSTTLQERNELENVTKWACGRPSTMGSAHLDSDPDELQNDVDLDTLSNSVTTHDVFRRYDDEDDQDDEDDDPPMFSEANEGLGNLCIAEEAPESWENSVDNDSSDEEGGDSAVAPYTALEAGAGEGDDDAVIVLTSEEEETLSADLVVDGGSPLRPGQQSPGLSPTGISSPKGQATAVIDDTEPQYNSFQYWKPNLMMEVPDDL
mmetsp:Transcript_9458/g.26990  ORF Transcript_9458/g.26990 Transcript_9458/m.26990 type:complete len:578 (+) Transcript_9458:485-2218(+)